MSPLRALAEACVTMLAAVATLACVWTLDPQVGSGVLAVVLCLALARSHLERDLRGRIEAAIALPVVGLAAVGAGLLLQRAPWLGAAVFVGAMFVSIWLRRFGAVAQRLGSLIALPFVALLVTPHVAASVGPVPTLLIPVLIGLLALFWVGALQMLARRLGLAPAHVPADTRALANAHAPAPAPARVDGGAPARAAPARASGLRPIASTRMAIQMAAALALSFLVGYGMFAERWAWIVLTAFIVLSGNRGRLDVAYKSMLRVLGAAGGTLLALVMASVLDVRAGAHDATTVTLILGAIFMGVWLRPLGYAWWALFVTVALALLQGFSGTPVPAILWPRLEEIVIGAMIGVATAWWLLPVRTSDVLRRRIADALAALSDAFDAGAGNAPDSDPDQHQHADATATATATAVAALVAVEQMAPACRAARAITGRLRQPQPADWIDALLGCRTPALALIDAGNAPAKVRKALGAARKAMRDPAAISDALQTFERVLTERH